MQLSKENNYAIIATVAFHGLVLLAYASGAFWVALAFTRKRFSK